ncbi:MAG: Undecaprenyl-diphosphatase [Parcubacteria group bacterium GW2011_GWB1_35_5]|nr:MAG: Undecaprenyl-diphosphatase [Parcubacteria group bacterium GW2011_GWB1_35_5]
MELHILEIIKAIILGVVEGLTEFLPISSTGHLILINELIYFDEDFTVLFDIVIQFGAIIAVLVYFIKKLWPFTKDEIKNKETLNIWYKTIVAILPAIFFGALFADFIKEKLFNPWVVIILFIENKKETIKVFSIEDLSFKTAFFIGLIQCLSMIPGVSRSASTIMGGIVLGASRVVSTEFSFFLAIPTMFAASAYSLLKYEGALNLNQIFILLIGFIVSFFVALAIVKFLINFVQKHNFKIFGYYRIILGIIILLYFLIK